MTLPRCDTNKSFLPQYVKSTLCIGGCGALLMGASYAAYTHPALITKVAHTTLMSLCWFGAAIKGLFLKFAASHVIVAIASTVGLSTIATASIATGVALAILLALIVGVVVYKNKSSTPHVMTYEHGKLVKDVYSRNGKTTKVVYYDRNGKITKTEQYDQNGILVKTVVRHANTSPKQQNTEKKTHSSPPPIKVFVAPKENPSDREEPYSLAITTTAYIDDNPFIDSTTPQSIPIPPEDNPFEETSK